MTSQEFEKIEESVSPSVKTKFPNEEIEVYNDTVLLQFNGIDDPISGLGTIHIGWLPTPYLKFTAKVASLEGKKILSKEDQNLLLNDGCSVPVRITTVEYENDFSIVSGRCDSNLLGDASISGDRLNFVISNLKGLSGSEIKIPTNSGYIVGPGRINLKNHRFLIVIDLILDHFDGTHLLHSTGGYHILYAGKVTCLKGKPISSTDRSTICEKLNYFLSFLHGGWVGPIAATLYHGDSKLSVDYFPSKLTQFLAPKSWNYEENISGLSEIFRKFSSMFDQQDDKSVIKSVVEWYIHSNNNVAGIKGSLILAQAAIELLYNYIAIESNEIIIGDDAASIIASNKMRILCSQIQGISENSITQSDNLKRFEPVKGKSLLLFDKITFIRNAIVHSEKSKRGVSQSIDVAISKEALEVYLSVIELSLLNVFKFKGKVANRLSPINQTSSSGFTKLK